MKHIELFGNWYHIDTIMEVSGISEYQYDKINGDVIFYFDFSIVLNVFEKERIEFNRNFSLSEKEVKDIHSKIIEFLKSQK